MCVCVCACVYVCVSVCYVPVCINVGEKQTFFFSSKGKMETCDSSIFVQLYVPCFIPCYLLTFHEFLKPTCICSFSFLLGCG